LFRSAQIVTLSVLVPWAVARTTERRGADFVLELVLTGSRGASVLVAKAAALVCLVGATLILTVPMAMVVLASTTIPPPVIVERYIGSFAFGSLVAVMSLHLNVNWRNPLFPLVLSWGLAGGSAGLYLVTFDPLAGGMATLGWGIGVGFIPFLRRLPRPTAGLFILAGAIYVGGAVGMEIIGEPLDSDTLTYNLLTAVEEGMEMCGVIVFMHALLRYMKGLGTADFVASVQID